jgi:hypothetical protein
MTAADLILSFAVGFRREISRKNTETLKGSAENLFEVLGDDNFKSTEYERAHCLLYVAKSQMDDMLLTITLIAG